MFNVREKGFYIKHLFIGILFIDKYKETDNKIQIRQDFFYISINLY